MRWIGTPQPLFSGGLSSSFGIGRAEPSAPPVPRAPLKLSDPTLPAGPFSVGETITAISGAFNIGYPAGTYEREWYYESAPGVWTEIPEGADLLSVVAPVASAGTGMRFRERVTNSEGSSEWGIVELALPIEPALAFIEDPSISPASGEEGTEFTINIGTFEGGASATRDWTLTCGLEDVTDDVVGGVFDSTGYGGQQLRLEVVLSDDDGELDPFIVTVDIAEAEEPEPSRAVLTGNEIVAFDAHSLLDTASGYTGFHGGIFDDIWNGTVLETYQGGSYISQRWAMNGDVRTAPSYAALMFTEMADFEVGYADPSSTEGINTLQYAFWLVQTAQEKGAQFACIYWAWSPPGSTETLDDDTMSKAAYLRQWLEARPEITIPVYVVPTAYYIRQVIDINEQYNPSWEIFADSIGHLNSSWQEVDESLSWLVWMMYRGIKAPDDGGRSAYLQALIDLGWNVLNQYECTGFGTEIITPYAVGSDPLPNPAPLNGGSAQAPQVTVHASFAPATADVGDLVTLFVGSASGSPSPDATMILRLDTVDITSEVSGSNDIVVEAGTYTLDVQWENLAGTANSNTATLVVTAEEEPGSSDITGGEGEITITSLTAPDALSVTGGEGEIVISGA